MRRQDADTATAIHSKKMFRSQTSENLSYLQGGQWGSAHGWLHVAHGTEHVGFRRVRWDRPSHHRVHRGHSRVQHFTGHLVDTGGRGTQHLGHPGREVGVGMGVGVGPGVGVGLGGGGIHERGSVDRGDGGSRQGLGDAGGQTGLVVGDPQLRGNRKPHAHPLGERPWQLVTSRSCTQGSSLALVHRAIHVCHKYCTTVYTDTHTQGINKVYIFCCGSANIPNFLW